MGAVASVGQVLAPRVDVSLVDAGGGLVVRDGDTFGLGEGENELSHEALVGWG